MAVMLLLLICMVAAAQVQVDLNESYTGGKVEATSQSEADAEGYVTVTIMVTPDLGYAIKKENILVVPTYPSSQTRTGEDPAFADKLELVGDDPADLSAAREYTFKVESEFGAWVKEANFYQVDKGISGDASSNVTWTFEASTLTISGTGVTASFDGEKPAPWASSKDKITSVVIAKGITGLGANLFDGCTSLASLKIENAEQVLKLGDNAIPANDGLKIDVPGNLLNEYQTTDGWTAFTIASENGIEMKDIAFSANNQYDAYVSKEALLVPSVLKAYAVTGVSGTGLVLTEVSVISPDVPVLVFNRKELEVGTYYSASAGDGTKGVTGSLLMVAPAGGQSVKLGEVYLLYNDVFYYCQAGTIPEGGIYLTNPSPEKSRSVYALGSKDGNTTGIVAPRLAADGDAPVWYGLDGRRLNTAPTGKGVYIMNGKKVVIK